MLDKTKVAEKLLVFLVLIFGIGEIGNPDRSLARVYTRLEYQIKTLPLHSACFTVHY